MRRTFATGIVFAAVAGAGVMLLALPFIAASPLLAQANDGVHLERFAVSGPLAGLVRQVSHNNDMKFSGVLALFLGLNPHADSIFVKFASLQVDSNRQVRNLFVTTVRGRIDIVFGLRHDGVSTFYLTSVDGERPELAKTTRSTGGHLELADVPDALVRDGFEREKAAWLEWLGKQSK